MNIENLYLRALNGDQKAEKELFSFISARFHYLAQLKIRDKMDAEEIAQDSIASVVRKYKEVRIESSFTGWVLRIIELDILNYYKKSGRREKLIREKYEINNSEPTQVSDSPLKRKLLGCLDKINKANVRHARILNLIHQGYELKDIAQRIGITLKNTYSSLYRARLMLEKCLENGDLSNE